MKLILLEDGVLDYKGDAAVLATPNGLPMASLGGVKPAPKPSPRTPRASFEDHIKECPRCSRNKLCEIGEKLSECL